MRLKQLLLFPQRYSVGVPFNSRFAMFYKIQYNLVEVPMPLYFKRPTRITHRMHQLSFRQVHVSADYYRYSFFPWLLFNGTGSLQI